MISFDLLVGISILYVLFLFFVAFLAERAAARGHASWLRSPLIYTLSLSIYCTAWTFYGAVGFAARSGLEFLTIYLGPTGVMIGWWVVLRRLVQIGRAQRITSIADLISSRFGKSTLLGGIVTGLAVIGTTPYIALQLQSVTLSLEVFLASGEESGTLSIAFWVAVGLAVFTIMFGTRNLDVNERHSGVVMAIAVEAVVKLFALLAVGAFVVWGVAGGVGNVLDSIDASPISNWEVSHGRWLGLTFLSAAAFLCLPRMFQVLVVENSDDRHLAVAGWAFPLYLLAMSLFVVPIAVVGLELMPEGSNPDLFVLTIPLAFGQDGLAMFAFLGGFSSATSMVIVAAIALSTMVSNHLVTPVWLQATQRQATVSGDIRTVVLMSRRISIACVLGLGFLYYYASGGGTALAAIGLVSFTGMAQVLPAMLAGLFWRNATRIGAAAGLLTGFIVWSYTLFLPSFGADVVISYSVLADGPFGLGWLRPQALFGVQGLDPVIHAVFWSTALNSLVLALVSLSTQPTDMERIQMMQYLGAVDQGPRSREWAQSQADSEDLLIMAQRILGSSEAQTLFRAAASDQGTTGYLPQPTPSFLETLERSLAGSVGAATANAMLTQMVGRKNVSVEDLLAVADETAQIKEYSLQLESKSAELSKTANQLSAANEKLTQLSHQKDAFLSQISHELRTPMTSIRAFSEILQSADLGPQDQTRYASIILDESQRLTRLLDDLLDLSVLENGSVQLDLGPARLEDILDRAVSSADPERRLTIRRRRPSEDFQLVTDGGRLAQVFINLIGNARKYCDAADPALSIRVRRQANTLMVDFVDNGSGISRVHQAVIFEKFSRVSDQQKAGSAGLGLAICKEIMENLGGSIVYLPGQGGAAFRVTVPITGPVANVD